MRPSFALGFARHTGRRRNELMEKLLQCMLTEALRSGRSKIQNYDIVITLAKAPCPQDIAPLFNGELMAEYNAATCKSPVVFVTLCRLNSHVATDAASAASVSGNAILFERARGGREGERRHEAMIPFTFPPSYILIWRFLGPNLCYSLFNLPFHE